MTCRRCAARRPSRCCLCTAPISPATRSNARLRALAAWPTVHIFDEPTEGIQPSIIKDIGRVLRRLAERGMNGVGSGPLAVVLVEQYYDFAAELADRYLVMERGEIVMHGRGKEMESDGERARLAI